MSKDEKGSKNGKKEEEKLMDTLKERVGVAQRTARDKGIPIIVIFEGWDVWGIPEKVNRFIRSLDPQGYELYFINVPDQIDGKMPFIWHHTLRMPARGQITIFDRSWYFRLVDDLYDSEKRYEFENHLRDIEMMESQHAKGGWVFIKFFLSLKKKDLAKRMKKVDEKGDFCINYEVVDGDYSDDYDSVFPIWKEVIDRTDKPYSPWTVIEDDDEDEVVSRIYETFIAAVDGAVERQMPAQSKLPPPDALMDKSSTLAKVDLDKQMDQDTYRKKLDDLQKRLVKLQCELSHAKRSLILVFEGWDAAGKGGAIIRLTQALNPRGYKVVPVSAPNDFEKVRHYLWRFYRALPPEGAIAIFDRSWYGRVLVERVEGFASQSEWRRAYSEINEMESMLSDSGCIIMKFWLHIDREVQLKRFHDREIDPLKQWKITEDDWRNREKWDLYVQAVDEMMTSTSRPNAPWIVVPSDDKYYSRVTVLKEVVERLEDELD